MGKNRLYLEVLSKGEVGGGNGILCVTSVSPEVGQPDLEIV